jgi:N-acetylglucosaminyldiphosphoundecaprenol N-acetyl-beta-D-mannosaminyltransferase
MGKVELLGCPCVSLDSDESAIDLVSLLLEGGDSGYSVAINAEKIMMYRTRTDIRVTIDQSALPYPDGTGAVLALRWLHGLKARKINMPIAVLRGADRARWRVFILGASEEVNRQACHEIESRFPGINLVGRLHGFTSDDQKIAAIKSATPQLVLVALGSPRQELFATRLVSQAPGLFVVGCGGALNILAGTVKRAPAFMVDHGLEWLYRLYKEPRRWRRQLMLPVFLARLAVEVVRVRLRLARKSGDTA